MQPTETLLGCVDKATSSNCFRFSSSGIAFAGFGSPRCRPQSRPNPEHLKAKVKSGTGELIIVALIRTRPHSLDHGRQAVRKPKTSLVVGTRSSRHQQDELTRPLGHPCANVL